MDSARSDGKGTAAGRALAPPPAGARARSMRRSTEDRLLEGALRAVASRGLAKLGMADVSEFAGLSRGTAYRYFADTEELLSELGRREAENLERQVWEAVAKVPPGLERLRVTLDYLGRLARDHPLVQRLPETDPGFVLTQVRARFPEIRRTFERLLVTVLEETSLVRRGVVTSEQLAGWAMRMMVSLFLFPDPNPEDTARSLTIAFQILTQSPAGEGQEPAGGREAADARPPRRRGARRNRSG